MRRRRKRQLAVEAAYWRRLATGVGVVAACAKVGISRKTGYWWRAETGGLAPEVLTEAYRSSRYLSRPKRHHVATLRCDGLAICEIGRRLGRATSTISRELPSNTATHDHGGHDGDFARARARGRTRRARTTRLAADPVLLALVRSKLGLEWFPEQIAAYLRVAFPERPAWHLCHESIYQGLYRGG